MILIYRIFTIVLCVSFSANLCAQDYQQLAIDTSYTFTEIVEQAELHFDSVGRGQHTGYKQFKRWEYWTKRSLDAQGKLIPDGKAYQNASSFRNKEKSSSSKMMTPNWMEMGPISATNTSTWSSHIGRLTSIGIDPNDANHYIVGGQTGGVWKTLDDGATWLPVFDNEAVLDVYALAVSPSNNQIYFCGTQGLGIMKSIDGGANWDTTSGVGSSERIIRIAPHPINGDIILALSRWGTIFKSNDAGDTWNIELDVSINLFDLEYKPGSPSTIYASGDGKVYKSTNTGNSFNEITGGPWVSNQAIMLAVTPDDNDYLYVLQELSGGFGGLYLSTNSGTTFGVQSEYDGTNNIMGYNLDQTGGQAPRDMDVAVNPADKTEVHVGGTMTYRSSNSGQTWTQSSHWVISNPLPFIHADCDFIFYESGKMYFGTDGGLFISTDGGDSFVDKTTGLGVRQFYRIGASKTEVDRVSGGSQDNGTGVVIGGTWFDWVGADGMETFIDKSNKDVIYASIQYGSLYKSVNGGNSLVGINNTPGSGSWVTPLEEDPILANTLYQGKSQVYKSTNGGSSWSSISNFNNGDLQEIAIAPTDNSVIFAAFNDEIHRTTNGGSSWTDVTPNISFSNVNYISIHPTDPQKILVVLSGTNQRVLESTNQGTTWNNITSNLPSIGAECAIYEGVGTGIYVGMNPGVYYTSDGTWATYMLDLPNVRIGELEIANSKLYAGSYGRGLWKTDPVVITTCTLDGIVDNGVVSCDNATGFYTRSLTVSYTDSPNSGTLNVVGQSFPITTSPQIVVITMNLDGETINADAFFSNVPSCSLEVPNLYTNPTNCPCIISSFNSSIESCTGNGTPTDTDDTFTVSINPTGTGVSGTFSVSGDITAAGLSYGITHVFDNGGSGFLVSDGDLNITVTDDVDSACLLPGLINAPQTCSDNYICENPIDIVGPGTYAAIGPIDGGGGSQSGQNANWFKYIATQDGVLTVESCESGVDTRLFVHSGACGSLIQEATSDDDCLTMPGGSTSLASQVELCVTNGVTYYIEWDDLNSQSSFSFDVDFTVFGTYYLDGDSDGYGDSATSLMACTQPTGYVLDNTDCDDTNASVYPGAMEVCDNLDNNCDGQTDEGVMSTFYQDSDGDGYGNVAVSAMACAMPSGYVIDNTDCDDANASNYPGNTEICDGSDNNCNGSIDEGCGALPNCDDIFIVINTLTQDTYRAEINITSDAIVNSTQSILYVAGTDIDLEPNFEVALGTEFEARIEGCIASPLLPEGTAYINLASIKELEEFVQNNYISMPEITLKDDKSKVILENTTVKEIKNRLLRIQNGKYLIYIGSGENQLIQQILIK